MKLVQCICLLNIYVHLLVTLVYLRNNTFILSKFNVYASHFYKIHSKFINTSGGSFTRIKNRIPYWQDNLESPTLYLVRLENVVLKVANYIEWYSDIEKLFEVSQELANGEKMSDFHIINLRKKSVFALVNFFV